VWATDIQTEEGGERNRRWWCERERGVRDAGAETVPEMAQAAEKQSPILVVSLDMAQAAEKQSPETVPEMPELRPYQKWWFPSPVPEPVDLEQKLSLGTWQFRYLRPDIST